MRFVAKRNGRSTDVGTTIRVQTLVSRVCVYFGMYLVLGGGNHAQLFAVRLS